MLCEVSIMFNWNFAVLSNLINFIYKDVEMKMKLSS